MEAEAQAVATSCGDRQARGQDLVLEVGDVLLGDQLMVDRRHRILPDQFLRRDLRAEIAGARTHVAVGQLEPGPGESIGEFLRVLEVAPRDRLVDRVEAQGEVRRSHHRAVLLLRVMRVNHQVLFGHILGQPLVGAGRALNQFPLILEQHLQVAHVPSGRLRLPGALNAAADRIAALAATEAALPAEALLFDGGAFRFRAHMRRRSGAVAFAEGVSPGDQRDGLLVVHRHARKGLADVTAGGHRVRFTVRPFRIHVDQPHLHGGQRVLEVPVAGITLVTKPFVLGAPVDVLLRLPDVLAAATEAEGLKAH